ncbi:MAG: M20/M25/M40 family metallo-hydrolase [Deltaproteobacteria bacterium]|nr:M20/M25/M40 family metallo-hydrolase [Deltaproteobacteria bacterium]
MNVFELSKQLIKIKSLSGHEEPLFQFLSKLLTREGFTVKKILSAHHRPNLFAYIQKPRILFSSHMDTVPPAIPFHQDSQYLYGRGACDTKSIIAAQIVAGLKLKARGIKDFGFLYVVGEEVDHRGAIDCASKIPKVEALIMGEPTQNTLAAGTKGIVKVTLKAFGKAAHSAYPELGRSAIHGLLETLFRIQNMPREKSSFLGFSNLNIGVLEGGVAANVLAPLAQAQILVRTVSSSRTVYRQMKKLCLPHVKINLESMNDPIRLDTMLGFKTSIVSFNTDLPYLKKKARKLFLLGPGSILDAHGPHEKISKKELLRSVELYQRLVFQIVTRPSTRR